MKVDPETARHSFEHDGKTHYFCSAGCRAKFAGDPEHYLAGRHREPMADAPEGAIYTCPMHPQVRQIGPGSCPICGMALEPETVSLETGPDPEYIDMLRRFQVSAALSVPLLGYVMAGMLPGRPLDAVIPAALARWFEQKNTTGS